MHCVRTLIVLLLLLWLQLSITNAGRSKRNAKKLIPSAKDTERENRLVDNRVAKVLCVAPIGESVIEGDSGEEGEEEEEKHQQQPEVCNTIVSRTHLARHYNRRHKGWRGSKAIMVAKQHVGCTLLP